MDKDWGLNSIFWAVTRDARRATEWARRVGQLFAWVLILIGVSLILGVRVSLPGISLFGGVWMVLAGWLLNDTAVRGYRLVTTNDLLRSAPIVRPFGDHIPTVPPNIPISSFMEDYASGLDVRSFPVVDNNRLVGLVCIEDAHQVPLDQWGTTEVGEIMTCTSQLEIVKRPSADRMASIP